MYNKNICTHNRKNCTTNQYVTFLVILKLKNEAKTMNIPPSKDFEPFKSTKCRRKLMRNPKNHPINECITDK